ncbi:hypothetical protein LWI28_000868 [Acer negundo]|uniref:Reverse transcriptase Ty1/copia-type domain-containing protein n=1 Tax=Acer negundo TaxID=4023 RepID=A0AAD5JGG3_ACENE|nr:hypothetical protein LWI28_000868 [Acer negundo]
MEKIVDQKEKCNGEDEIEVEEPKQEGRKPEGFENVEFPSHVCRLKKALKQAPMSWFTKLQAALVSWGFLNSASDTSLFIKHIGSDVLYLLVYVDDILITCTSPSLVRSTISQLHNSFALKALGSVADGLVEPRFVPTDSQIADILIKALASTKFNFFCSKLNLVFLPQFSLTGDVRVEESLSRPNQLISEQKKKV